MPRGQAGKEQLSLFIRLPYLVAQPLFYRLQLLSCYYRWGEPLFCVSLLLVSHPFWSRFPRRAVAAWLFNPNQQSWFAPWSILWLIWLWWHRGGNKNIPVTVVQVHHGLKWVFGFGLCCFWTEHYKCPTWKGFGGAKSLGKDGNTVCFRKVYFRS